jgi:hypothetical protein
MPLPDNIITGIFSTLSLAIGGLIGYSTSIAISNRKDFNREATTFINVFIEVLIDLDQRYRCREIKEETTFEIIKKTFPDQMKAMLRFRQYLPKSKRAAFDDAWREYCHYENKNGPSYQYPFLEQYFHPSWNNKNTRDIAIKRIEKLLSFAEIDHTSPFAPPEEI